MSDLLAPDGRLLARTTVTLTTEDAQALRVAAKALRRKRYRMTVRCDECFEEHNLPDGTRGEISPTHIYLECRCRTLQFDGRTA